MKREKTNLKNSKYKVVFFGTPAFVNPILDKLQDNFDVVKEVRTPEIWNEETIQDLKSLNPDFFVVASYGQILSAKVLNIPKVASINIHPSLLPQYRGPSPIQSAILNGNKTTGVTIIKMDEEVDHGPILDQFEEEIKPDDTFESLAIRLFEKSAEKLVRVISAYDKTKLQPQNESQATQTKLLTREDGFIDSSIINHDSSIIGRIRAFYPWPGVWTKYKLTDKDVMIKFLPEKKLQVEGKKPMNYKDFINGYEKGKELLGKLNLQT